jgi:hypothetical protein
MYQHLYKKTINQLHETTSTFVDYDRNHVFFDILRFSSNNISQEEKQDMYYQFNCYQRILDNARSGKPKLAEYWIDHLAGLPINYSSETSQHGMNCLHYPALAYYFYVVKDYANALDRIESSFKSIDALFDAGFQEAVFMKIEQKLNEFRIHFSTNQRDTAFQVMGGLLSYLVSEQKNTDFQIPASKVARNHEEVIGLFNYCFDSLFFRIYRSKNSTASFQDEFMERIIKEVSSHISPEFDFLQKPLQAFEAVMNNDEKTFLQLASENELFDDRLPAMMRYAYLLFMARVFNDAEMELGEFDAAFLSYNKTKLKLPDLFVDVFIKTLKNEEYAIS